MAASNPPAYIQASSHSSDIFRRLAQDLAHGGNGVVNTGDLLVSALGTPNMSVNVAAGRALILGTENTLYQGAYDVLNDGVVNLTVSASDPTNARIDIVVARVQDAQYSGATNAWSLAIVTGVAAPTPVAPNAPNNSIILAQVAVPALAPSIVAGNITDTRPQLGTTAAIAGATLQASGAGGVAINPNRNIGTTSSAVQAPSGYTGVTVGDWGFSSGGTLWYNAAGTFQSGSVIRFASPTVAGLATLTAAVPTGFSYVEITGLTRSTNAATSDDIWIRFNGDSSANYFWQQVYGNNNAASGQQVSTGTASPPITRAVGGTGQAGFGGAFSLTIPNVNSTGLAKMAQGLTQTFEVAGAAGMYILNRGVVWNGAAAITSITLGTASGNNWATGSVINFYGRV